MKTRGTIILLCLSLCGCASAPGSGQHWYNPTTWFSGSAGRASAAVEAKIEKASDKATAEAQKAAHATQNALALAPQSRPVDVARASNDNTVALLDQVSGPLSAADAAQLKERVRLLVSDVATERAKGEALQADSQQKIESVSRDLAELAEAKKKADADLAKSFERENALANELRNEKWWSWFWRLTIGSAVILALAAYVYLRLTVGGLPTALSSTLASLRNTDPAIADKLTAALDVHTSRAEQAMIRLLVAKKST